MGGGWSTSRPGHFTPGKTRCPLYRMLCGPQGRSGRVRKISPPTAIRSPDRPVRGELLYRLSYPGPYVSHSARFLILTAVLAIFLIFLDVKLCRWMNIPQCFEGRSAPLSSGSSRVKWLQHDLSKYGNCSPNDKTSHPTRAEYFSLSVQYNTLRLAPVHFLTKLYINTLTLRSLLKLTPRPHICTLCPDIACTVHCVDFNIFVQQMHNVFINNYLFLTALLHVSILTFMWPCIVINFL